VGSFDPFLAKEVSQKRGGQNVYYRLKLKDVYERGWTKSRVTKFRYSSSEVTVVEHYFSLTAVVTICTICCNIDEYPHFAPTVCV
jgi:hypothetical protein